MEPHVVEVDGTTREIAWVPLDRARGLPLSGTARHALELVDALGRTRGEPMNETVFTYAAPALKFGTGASDEIGHDLTHLRRPPRARRHRPRRRRHRPPAADRRPDRRRTGSRCAVFDRAHVEPTDVSLDEAVAWARAEGPWDAFVAVGGGSAIDTAKAVNLLTTNEGGLMDYINAPVGRARAPQHPLKPLVAVPTTTGTGSESTTICVLDVLSLHVKTGISHPRLRPTLAVVDPLLTLSQPAGVTAAAGMDILCHALESWTARPFSSYERKQPEQRVPYCGANPVADMWAEKSLGAAGRVVPTRGAPR